jgi:hypothetical protein
MNPRPIIIATCCAIALVAFVYFYGKQHFSPSVDGTVHRTTGGAEPITVKSTSEDSDALSPTTSESPLTNSPTRTIEEVHQAQEETDKRHQALLDKETKLLEAIAAEKRTLAKLEAEKKARQEQDERELAEIKELSQWLQAEIIPKMNVLLPDLAFFFDNNIEPSTNAFIEKYPDPNDQRYYLNKFARYEEYLDQITTRVANASESYQKRFLRVGVQLWGEEATQYLASEINRKIRAVKTSTEGPSLAVPLFQ